LDPVGKQKAWQECCIAAYLISHCSKSQSKEKLIEFNIEMTEIYVDPYFNSHSRGQYFFFRSTRYDYMLYGGLRR